jgi:hypothetical protein
MKEHGCSDEENTCEQYEWVDEMVDDIAKLLAPLLALPRGIVDIVIFAFIRC